MNKRVFLIGLLGTIIMSFGIVTQQSNAAVQRETGDYLVEYVAPKEQVSAVRYYDVLYKPDTKHEIEAQVVNLKNKKITVHTSLNTTLTSMSGDFESSQNKSLFDKSMAYPFSELGVFSNGKKNQAITLKPNETKNIKMTIQSPKKAYNGVIHGSWDFIEYSKVQKGAFTSNYAYSIGVQLQGTQLKSDPKLSYVDTIPMAKNHFPIMGIGIRNSGMMYLTKANVKATVRRKGFLKSSHEKIQSDVRIAPNTLYRIPIEWNYDTLKAGEYEVDVQINGENYYNKTPMNWHFTKTFTVTKNQVSALDKQIVHKPIGKMGYIAGVSAFIALLSVIGLIYIKKFV